MHTKRPATGQRTSGRPFLVVMVSLFVLCVYGLYAGLLSGQEDNCAFTFAFQPSPTPAVDIETSLRISALSLAIGILSLLLNLFFLFGAHHEPRQKYDDAAAKLAAKK